MNDRNTSQVNGISVKKFTEEVIDCGDCQSDYVMCAYHHSEFEKHIDSWKEKYREYYKELDRN